jgi:hypothetical protein
MTPDSSSDAFLVLHHHSDQRLHGLFSLINREAQSNRIPLAYNLAAHAAETFVARAWLDGFSAKFYEFLTHSQTRQRLWL